MASNNSTNSVITLKLFLTLIGVKPMPSVQASRTQFTSTVIQEYKHVHLDFVQLALISLVCNKINYLPKDYIVLLEFNTIITVGPPLFSSGSSTLG